MSCGVIFCPVCKKTIELEADFSDLVCGFSEDVTSNCPACGAGLVTPVTMDIAVGKTRLVSGATNEKFLALQSYYKDRRLENLVEPWFVKSHLPVHFILRDEIWAKTTFQDSEFVTDGYTALRVSGGASFRCANDNSATFFSFLKRVAEDPGAPAQLIARVVGADLHGDRVEDYAALRSEDGRILFLLAIHVEAILGHAPAAQFLVEKNGGFVVAMVDGCLRATLARLEVDESRYDQVAGFGGVA